MRYPPEEGLNRVISRLNLHLVRLHEGGLLDKVAR